MFSDIIQNKVSIGSNLVRLRLFFYLSLSKNFCIITVMLIPKTAMKVQQITALPINAECKISALATMMLMKKEDRVTNMIIKM